MSYQIPSSAPSLEELARRQQNVITASQLRARGVPSRVVSEHCRRGGPWQRLLPRVYLLQTGTPTPEQRMWAALLYAAQNGREEGRRDGAVITGAAALALYGFAAVPRLPAVTGVQVLVPRQRRLRDVGEVRIQRTARELEAREVHGLACAPVGRAVADALREWTEGGALDSGVLGPRLLRSVLREAVAATGPDGRRACTPAELIAELREAQLVEMPRIRAALDELLAAERQFVLGQLLELAAAEQLPAPLVGPELRMRGGTFVAVPDLYWPQAAVAVEVDSAVRCVSEGEAAWLRAGQHRMEYLGVRVVYLDADRVATEPAAVSEELRQAFLAGGADVVELLCPQD
ncbi:type IV toxin-antitoxin system AbiEi family antitoxin domain-containing protein [Kitasatospora azatica]|uniref:type IV toxin-antitoxin system AbiEi family antitoxin domain-containing protein n=1 Tax=Kitasatospora azatica TaxID=58347 RepID=UPI00068FC928|nr:type IV toxin-antitoxin system AbiEi family antitoxin domain-containing protein [Kitasatospora azatica]